MPRTTRPHHLLVQRFFTANTPDGFIRREDLIDVLLNSRYASTARGKISGYINDIRNYDDGILEERKEQGTREISAWRLTNLATFDPRTGFNKTIPEDESPSRRRDRHIAERRCRREVSHPSRDFVTRNDSATLSGATFAAHSPGPEAVRSAVPDRWKSNEFEISLNGKEGDADDMQASKKAYYAARRRKSQPRSNKVGRLGEEWARELLARFRNNDGSSVFKNINDLNFPIKNYPYADISANRIIGEKVEELLLVSVKTRNKFETIHDPHTGRDRLKYDRFGNPILNKK